MKNGLLKMGITAGATALGGPLGGVVADKILSLKLKRKKKGIDVGAANAVAAAPSPSSPIHTGIIQDIQDKIGATIIPTTPKEKLNALWLKHAKWAMPVLMFGAMALFMAFIPFGKKKYYSKRS